MVETKKVPEGYKKTDIGIIPEEWNVMKIGDIFEFKNGLNKEKKYFGLGFPIVNYTDVYNNRSLTAKDIKGKVDVSLNEIRAYEVRKDDVFFTRTSETPDEIGITSVITEEFKNTVFSGFILRARPKKFFLNTSYKKYCFSSYNVRKEIISKCTYTTRALTNGKILSQIFIPIPSISEQKAIAEVLGDADKLISSLEKLIDKKQKIKQGVMQQLLTGKKRLNGFDAVWQKLNIGDVLTVKHGKSQHEVVDGNGKYPILATGGIIGKANGYLYNKPSVLIGRKGTIDKPQFIEAPFWTIDTLFYTEISDRAVPKYIYYLFNIIDWYSYNEASGVPSLNASTIEKINIILPEVIEQQAIAKILSDMDLEIQVLEQKLEKYNNIKRGMMQELLTGRKRLI